MDIKEFIIKELGRHPADIVNLAMKRFKVSRPAVHKHLKALIRDGKVHAEGRTRNKRYLLASSNQIRLKLPLSSVADESALWREKIKERALSLPKNIYDICEYGFTEMVNNVIDHSEAKTLFIHCDFSKSDCLIRIGDDGIGVFQKIKQSLKLETYREAILHLSKGKLTTDPKRHSGEGIFFTSRMFDRFCLISNGLAYHRFEDNDWLLNEAEEGKGTLVSLTIAKNSSRQMADVFNEYGDPKGDYSFSKTKVVVALGLNPDETYISRSQAKRILFGLEKFKYILLDFKKVSTVGQGFVDEVFRVFHEKYPEIRIEYVNANENVDFMIKRSLPDKPL